MDNEKNYNDSTRKFIKVVFGPKNSGQKYITNINKLMLMSILNWYIPICKKSDSGLEESFNPKHQKEIK